MESEGPSGSSESARRPRLALRMALTLFVVLSVLGTAMLIHLSWSYTARQNVADVAKQLNEQIVASIRTELTNVLRNIQATEEAVRSIFYQGAIAPEDEAKREFIFLALLQSQPVLSRISFGWPTGDFFGTENFDAEIHNVEVKWHDARRPFPAGVAQRRVDRYLPEPGEPRFLDRTLEPSAYSVLKQPWYKKAVRADKTVWTQTADFPDSKQPGVNISGSLTLYGQFIGVINVTVELGRLSSFLAEQRVGTTGTVAILDSARNVIASQDPAERVAEAAGMMRNLDRLDSAKSPLLAVVREALTQNMLQLSEVKMIQPLAPVRASDGALYYVSLSPANFRDWSVVTIIPEKDFLGNIDRNTQRLLYGVAAFTLAMIFASILLADRLIGRPLIRIAGQLGNIESFRLDRIARVPSRLRELDDLSGAIMQMARGLTSFQKYLPTELVRTLVSQGIEAKPGGQQQTLTVLFSDLAGFTALSERLGPGIVPVLTAYLSAASKAIVAEKGTIDKFIGDAVMAFWGAPIPDAHHAEDACRAALACRRAMASLPGAAGGERLALRIGVNTGPMLVGNVGSQERLNYTVIGDAVNLASRLESLNKSFGTGIIIGEATRLAAGDAVVVRELDKVAVYGRMESAAVFELLAMADEKPDAASLAWVAIYEAGLSAYRERRWPEAVELLGRAAAARGCADPPAMALMERCRALIANPPDAGWRPVTVMGTK